MIQKLSVLLLVSMSLLAGCAVPRQAFDKQASASLKKIVIADRADEESYEARLERHVGGAFGLIGAAVAEADMAAKSSRLTKALDPAKTRVQQKFIAELASRLKAMGYETEIVAVGKGLDPVATVNALKAKATADAYMYVDVQAKYIAPGGFSPYTPYIVTKIRVAPPAGDNALYEDTISWGYNYNQSRMMHLPGGYTYRYQAIEDLEANADKVREGLYEGIPVLVTEFSNSLKKN
ncbi:MAG: hypothetical protein QM776_01520 [Rhodocyclaceae bacterium]